VPINPSTDRYILEGRVVTMGPRGVIDNGRIYLHGRVIEAVGSAAEPTPAEFTSAPRVTTGDTIYPGLIELHNHLSYNAMPLWDVPTKYTNNGQWRGGDDYSRKITKPSQVLGQTPGVLQALVRYVECRAMLGGVTSTQGITLANASGIVRHYKGLVRNVEQPMDPELRAAGTNIANPEPNGAAAYLTKLVKQKGSYLQHLSEGTDATARSWFLRLKVNDHDWAVTSALCGIHSAALKREDFDVLVRKGASMVWSPLSNYLLYGETADLRAARDSGIRMAIGSDWAPSGSKNLLGELKVAWLASQGHADPAGNPVFSAEDIVRMATINPAQILRWDAHLGSIEAGKWADLVVVNGHTREPYRQLIEARETSITLVVIDGVPRLGQAPLMNKFGTGTEEVKVGGSRRTLNLAEPSADPLVGAESLTHATAVLADGMARLPELASQLDNAVAMGAFMGAQDAAGAQWRVVPDFEADDLAIAAANGIDLAAEPYAFWVSPMTLDPITVADDAQHLRILVGARNLPDFVKKGLPDLYGRTIPLPEGADFLTNPREPVAPQVIATTRSLGEFLRTSGELSLEDRRTIVDQALLVLQENYVHLPLKRAMHAVDPVQRLRLLARRLAEQADDDTVPREVDFHTEVTDIFNSLRDLHTGYRLPAPFSDRVAWLPFLVEECLDRGRQAYLVTKVVAGAGPADFVPGVEVTHWNGMSMDQAIARNGERQAGSNRDARHARGLNSLTMRPLARSLPPDEEWVTLRYVPLDAARGAHPKPAEYRQEWLVFEPGQAGRFNPADLVAEATAVGVDDHTDDIQHVRKTLFAPAVAAAEAAAEGQVTRVAMATGGDDVVATTLPGVLKARVVQRSDAGPGSLPFGYLRIYTFNVAEAGTFIDEFIRLVSLLPVNGLILDVRGNGGGLIYAAEGLLQVLSPRQIQPERAQFITTPLNLTICRNHAISTQLMGLELKPWVRSIGEAVQTGATYSQGFPITPDDFCNAIGQRYFGPTVLITDPLCYSATDMFSAGFQDHGIGKVIGVRGATGAGGANVWSHGLLSKLMAPDNIDPGASPYKPLPRGSDIRVAARRTTRAADNPGDVLEDLGVRPDIRYEMTARDVLGGNSDLIDRAIDELATHKPHAISVEFRPRAGHAPAIVVHATNVTRIDARIDTPSGSRWLASRPVRRGRVELDPEEVLDHGVTGEVGLVVVGYERDSLVARLRETIALG
jgi:cytosine/adenosine deaminase-related metal-dependent hydrolase/C-terminal processing protease CtpA/Prc